MDEETRLDESPGRTFPAVAGQRPDLLGSLLHNVGEGILLLDRRGALVAANPAADRILGLTRRREPIASWSEAYGLFRPGDPTPFPKEDLPLVRALRGESCDDIELEVRNEWVGRVLVSVSARPLLAPDGSIEGVVAVLRDVTRREAARRELHQNTVFVDLLKRIAVAANEAGTMEEAFQRALETICTTIGWPFGEAFLVQEGPERILLPTTIRYGSEPHKKKGASALSAIGGPIQMVLSTRRAMWIFDVSLPTDVGGPSPGGPAAFAFPVLAGEEPVAVMEFRADRAVEPDERLLEVMANVGTQLGRAVERHRARERLEALAGALERSNAELGEFAYSASHDLREPLRTIASHLKIVLEKAEAFDVDDRKSLLHAIDAADRLQRQIDSLLAYSRVTTQGRAFAPTDMDAVVGVVLGNLEVALREAGASVTHDPLPTIFGDEAQLSQLVQNLIANAIKFRGKRAPVVHVGIGGDEAEWVFSVQDNGIGIPADQQDRMFRLFQRLHTHKEYPGSGIGLATCKRIVERHGGRIWVESTPGEGSIFRFAIPKPQGGFE